MSKTIFYSFILASIALLCSGIAVFFEMAAENNRLQLEAVRILIMQQESLRRDKINLILEGEEEFSEILSSVPFRARPKFNDYFKEMLFFAGVSTLRFESNHIKTIDWAYSFTPEIEEEALDLVEEVDSFLLDLDPDQLSTLSLEEYKRKFGELQNLLSRLNIISKKAIDSLTKKSQKHEVGAKALSLASTYLIFSAFLLEILIFLLIQFLEIRTERRLR